MKPRRCTWCQSKDHEASDCPEREKRFQLQKRIAERQTKPWVPRRKGGHDAGR